MADIQDQSHQDWENSDGILAYFNCHHVYILMLMLLLHCSNFSVFLKLVLLYLWELSVLVHQLLQ